MNVVFRTDASIDIGTGHVIRCLTLAQVLRSKGAKCYFVCRQLEGHMIELIIDRGFETRALPVATASNKTIVSSDLTKNNNVPHYSWLGVEWQIDAQQTKEVLDEVIVDLLIVDHYGIDIYWENIFREVCKNLIVIDDLADRRHSCDLLIDQTLGRRPHDYKMLVPGKCKILTGSAYALVRPEFSALRETAYDRVLSDPPLRVLVSMGGTDQPNASLSILKLLSIRSDLKITVLLSPRAKNYESVASFCRDYQNICHIDFSEDMATLMTKHDIAIGAPGSTSWERACLGLPSIIIPLADNQHEIGENLKKYKAAIVIKLAELEGLFWKSFQQILSEWTTYQTANLQICDGLGIYRVSIELDSFRPEAVDYRLLPACEADIGDIFKWQIHPLTRKYAVNTKIPTWDEHKTWMRHKLKNITDYFYITSQVVTKEKMGAVRLDRLNNGCYEVSIYTAPDRYGQGVAKAALNIIDQIHPHLTIEATVLKDNIGSQRLFERANYQRISDEKFIRNPII